MTQLASDRPGLKISHDDHLLADEFLRLVPRLDPGTHLPPGLRTVIQMDLEQSIGIGMGLGLVDGGDICELTPRAACAGAGEKWP